MKAAIECFICKKSASQRIKKNEHLSPVELAEKKEWSQVFVCGACDLIDDTRHRVFVPANRCLRCGHVWLSRKENTIACAKCKSPYWHISKKVY